MDIKRWHLKLGIHHMIYNVLLTFESSMNCGIKSHLISLEKYDITRSGNLLMSVCLYYYDKSAKRSTWCNPERTQGESKWGSDMLVECFVHLFRARQKGVALLSSGQYNRSKQLINTWGLKMHNYTYLSAAPVSLEEFREGMGNFWGHTVWAALSAFNCKLWCNNRRKIAI